MASRSNGQMPISRHPLFPLVVALWFAALLGLGSLAIRASVLERIVLALQLDLVIPAAAPPLGFTARMLLSLALTCGGGVLGYVLARRIGRSVPTAPARRQRAGGPIVVAAPPADALAADMSAEDDGEDLAHLDAARAELPRRRRALTAGEDLPDAMPLDFAPLPASALTDPDSASAGPRILNFGDLEPMPPLDAPAGPFADPGIDHAPRHDDADWAAPAPAFHPAPAPMPGPTAERRPAVPPVLAPLPLAASAPINGTAALRLRAAPLDSLGVVELVERFALALAARRHRTEAAPAVATPPPFASPASFHGSEFAAPEARIAPAPDPAEEWGGDDGDLPENEFSSLLDMKPMVRPTIAPEGEASDALAQPVVIFPGQALNGPGNGQRRAPGAAFGTSPVETEQALREALAALQRMSGAA